MSDSTSSPCSVIPFPASICPTPSCSCIPHINSQPALHVRAPLVLHLPKTLISSVHTFLATLQGSKRWPYAFSSLLFSCDRLESYPCRSSLTLARLLAIYPSVSDLPGDQSRGAHGFSLSPNLPVSPGDHELSGNSAWACLVHHCVSSVWRCAPPLHSLVHRLRHGLMEG